MSQAAVHIDELSPELRRELGLPAPRRQQSFSKSEVRTHAIKCIAAIANLTQDQRRRVLEHALKINKV